MFVISSKERKSLLALLCDLPIIPLSERGKGGFTAKEGQEGGNRGEGVQHYLVKKQRGLYFIGKEIKKGPSSRTEEKVQIFQKREGERISQLLCT